MKIKASTKFVAADAVVVFLSDKKYTPTLKKTYGEILPPEVSVEISARMKEGDFSGKKNETLQVFQKLRGVQKIILVGVGDLKTLEDQRKAAGTAIRAVKKLKLNKATFVIPKSLDAFRILSGAIAGAYEFKIGDTSERVDISSLNICTPAKISASDLEREIAVGEAVNVTRDLINYPAGHMSPEDLEKRAKDIAKTCKKMKVTVLDEKKLKKMNAGGILGVGQGAHIPPRMIIIEYKGGAKEAPEALVGKGVCFDSGGYNLKPTNHIEGMHSDMGGAGTVLGVFHYLAATQPAKNVIGVLGAVENMISGTSFKPSDIITMANGQTCQVTNTDAEGRLVLADCLHHVVTKYKPSHIIDFATLTGACVAALGNEITGIMTNTPSLLETAQKAAEENDELVWELPIIPLFREKIKGDNSDLLCWTAGVGAGSSMAGAFLENFVQDTPWLHCDIAGTAFHDKSGSETAPRGATGAMVRTICSMMK